MAIIVFHEPQSDNRRMRVVTHAEAKKLQLALEHPERVTDAAVKLKLASIKAVYLSRQAVIEDYGIKQHSGLMGGS